eukprot:6313714-Alexandrium_andersonii.AAC.1
MRAAWGNPLRMVLLPRLQNMSRLCLRLGGLLRIMKPAWYPPTQTGAIANDSEGCLGRPPPRPL